ncbi:DUF2517 family protein [Echinimonas agarilytica]|uniref:YbfA family protein n=1 Tax=Echinimonas agarilytica TaxID=1215918 RepID=A0AA42B868_9GAMM|nr:DUF2517 family protein [Echinimonas agarilytica]MCM2679991.1 YbfA family protein [Echinimonas agarilytica]
MFSVYHPMTIILRRIFVVFTAILSLPAFAIPAVRGPLGSYLHRFWVKSSDKPVWMQLQDAANGLKS